MLGIVSTTGKDFRPAAERAQAYLDLEAARKKLLPRPERALSDDEILLAKHQRYLDAKLAATTVNDDRSALEALRANKEIRAELARQEAEVQRHDQQMYCGSCGEWGVKTELHGGDDAWGRVECSACRKKRPKKHQETKKPLEADSFGYDTATVGYHRPQASETHGVASCPTCNSSRRGTIMSSIGASVEASCGDCGETWYYDDRF